MRWTRQQMAARAAQALQDGFCVTITQFNETHCDTTEGKIPCSIRALNKQLRWKVEMAASGQVPDCWSHLGCQGVVPAASVTVTNVATNGVLQTITNERG